MRRIFILNGPNLNLLGDREPQIYGTTTLAEVEKICRDRASALDVDVEFRQTNSEGTLIDWIHQARKEAAGIIINPAAFSHTSYAVREALAIFEGPVIEVHISNIHSREKWRATSVISEVVEGVIAGVGVRGYWLALEALAAMIKEA